ncbi:hypothetical protein BDF14DRAFT_1965372, partial [Spinellus fusiger]
MPPQALLDEKEQDTFSEFLNSFFMQVEECSEQENGHETSISPQCNDVKTLSPRDVLTEEEKRANHILSEQKRRNTIRNGFKDLTHMIPTLKNINNSKSTVLFKAVDYIRCLEKRNKSLRDKLLALQIKAQVKHKMNLMTGRSFAPIVAPTTIGAAAAAAAAA